jgi:hypothetical protein
VQRVYEFCHYTSPVHVGIGTMDVSRLVRGLHMRTETQFTPTLKYVCQIDNIASADW